jgi:hypothetical protein
VQIVAIGDNGQTIHTEAAADGVMIVVRGILKVKAGTEIVDTVNLGPMIKVDIKVIRDMGAMEAVGHNAEKVSQEITE